MSPGIGTIISRPASEAKAEKPARNLAYAVLVSDGTRVRKYPITEIRGYLDGLRMTYQTADHQKDVVYVGSKYRPLQMDGTFLVGKHLGNNSAALVLTEEELAKNNSAVPLIGPSTDPDCPGQDLSQLVGSDIFATGLKTLSTGFNMPWKWILIIGGAALAIFLIYKFKGGA
jgi:hypothetical protein